MPSKAIIPRRCHYCGIEFLGRMTEIRRGGALFCSPSCQYAAVRAGRIERFWSKVKKTETCWVWTASVNRFGHGVMGLGRVNRRGTMAHRFAWEITFGAIPDGLHVCHHCDNPPCVRPDHLFLGTQADNIADMWRKGRGHPPLAEQHPRATITRELALAVRQDLESGRLSADVSRYHDVSPKVVHLIKAGRHWAVRGLQALC